MGAIRNWDIIRLLLQRQSNSCRKDHKGIAGFYYVHGEDGEIYECKAKGIFRRDKKKPLVGDDVEITVLDEKDREGNLIRILPRRNSLIRRRWRM